MKKLNSFFANKEINRAKEVLASLEKTALLRLPVVDSLNKRIRAEEEEMKEAWEYLQKILN